MLIIVPVANTTPRPLLTSCKYWHFRSISKARWLEEVVIPATFRSFVNTKQFL